MTNNPPEARSEAQSPQNEPRYKVMHFPSWLGSPRYFDKYWKARLYVGWKLLGEFFTYDLHEWRIVDTETEKHIFVR